MRVFGCASPGFLLVPSTADVVEPWNDSEGPMAIGLNLMDSMRRRTHNGGMEIWVDADACPKVIKEILFRAADRVNVQVTPVANQAIQVPRSKHIPSIKVPAGPAR